MRAVDNLGRLLDERARSDDDEAFLVQLVPIKLDDIDRAVRRDAKLLVMPDRAGTEQQHRAEPGRELSSTIHGSSQLHDWTLQVIPTNKDVKLKWEPPLAPSSLNKDSEVCRRRPFKLGQIVDDIDELRREMERFTHGSM